MKNPFVGSSSGFPPWPTGGGSPQNTINGCLGIHVCPGDGISEHFSAFLACFPSAEVFLQLRFSSVGAPFRCGTLFVWDLRWDSVKTSQGGTSNREGARKNSLIYHRKKAIQTTCFPQDLRQTCCLTPFIPKAAEFPGNSMAETNHRFLFRKWKRCTIVLFFFLFLFFLFFGGKNNFWIPSPLSEGSYNGAQTTVTFHNVGDMMELELISHLQGALCKTAPVFPGPTNAQLLEEANN